MGNRAKRRRRRKRQGHYCWACDCHRPNERFSGRNHSRHLCRDCQKLGAAELNYRRDVRNIERHLNWDGHVGRKGRAFVARFLYHDDLRLRAWAEELLTGIPVDEVEDIDREPIYGGHPSSDD